MNLLNRCQAETYCKGFGTKCSVYCVGYVQLQTIYALSKIPKKYQFDIKLKAPDCDYDVYVQLNEFKDDIEAKIEQGEGLFLLSETKGNGKTSWACKIANEYIKKIALTNNMRCRVLFINVPRFIDRMKDAFDKDDDELDEMKQDIHECDLVIWDDIGTETPTTWVRTQLYNFISHREAEGLSQFFTSNVPIETLEDETYLGERIVSRILGQCEVVEFFGRDERKERNR